MDRMIDFEFESSVGNVFVEATADITYRNGFWDYEEIEFDFISDLEGRCVKHLLKPSDFTFIYAEAVKILAKIDLNQECEDALADEWREERIG